MSYTSTVFRAKSDLNFFAEVVLGYRPGAVHRRMFAETIFNRSGINRYVCVIAARGHLKTTNFSIIYPLWRLWREDKFKICLTSSSFDQAKKVLEEIKTHIRTNELLKEMKLTYGSQTMTWNKFEIETENGNQFFIKPFNPTIRGTHVDLYICDDILREENTTHEQIKEKFWSLIYPCIQTRKGQLVVVGTPLMTDDLLADLSGKDENGAQNHPEWICKSYPACKMDENGNLSRPIWPENFTIADLEAIRKAQGSLIFDREYLCNPIAGSSALFPTAVLHRQIWNPPVLNKPRKMCQYYVGVDIALSPGGKTDWNVITILEKDEHDVCRMVQFERFKTIDSSFIIQRVKYWARRFNARKIIVEDRGLSQGIATDLTQDKDVALIVQPFKTNKNNKEELVAHLQAGFQNGTLFIPNNPLLLKELQAFGIKKDIQGKETYEALSGHDDTVISLGLAFEGATVLKGGAAGFDWV